MASVTGNTRASRASSPGVRSKAAEQQHVPAESKKAAVTNALKGNKGAPTQVKKAAAAAPWTALSGVKAKAKAGLESAVGRATKVWICVRSWLPHRRVVAVAAGIFVIEIMLVAYMAALLPGFQTFASTVTSQAQPWLSQMLAALSQQLGAVADVSAGMLGSGLTWKTVARVVATAVAASSILVGGRR